jgi:hypothetical protein
MKFTLTLKLGNEAMNTALDVAEALRKAAHQLNTELGPTEITDIQDGFGHAIMDLNGNNVGSWQFDE